MLISFAVTTKLICVFVSAYAKSRFSHDEANFHMEFTWKIKFQNGKVFKKCKNLGEKNRKDTDLFTCTKNQSFNSKFIKEIKILATYRHYMQENIVMNFSI